LEINVALTPIINVALTPIILLYLL
jgi:hypothetical protein